MWVGEEVEETLKIIQYVKEQCRLWTFFIRIIPVLQFAYFFSIYFGLFAKKLQFELQTVFPIRNLETEEPIVIFAIVFPIRNLETEKSIVIFANSFSDS